MELPSATRVLETLRRNRAYTPTASRIGDIFRSTPRSFSRANDRAPNDRKKTLCRTGNVGSDALDALDALFPPPPPRAGWYSKTKEQDPQTDRDTYALLRDNRHRDERLQELWDEVNTVPDWVDWEQIGRGQEVFYRYAPAVIAGFAFQGLLATTVCSSLISPFMHTN